MLGLERLRAKINNIRRPRSFRQEAKRLADIIFTRGQSIVLDTSASDNGRYPLFCYLASKEEKIFQGFKHSIIYTQVLEHVTQKLGGEYLDVINRTKAFTFDEWQEFSKNDLYGEPARFSYEINGKSLTLSPTTIRYAKVLCDIITQFNAGEIKSIAEIGIGYGGQCRIICSMFQDVKYTLFDLPEVFGLAERYLNNYQECKSGIRYVDGGHIYIHDNYDLVISNYAFSELRRNVQDMYLDKIILRSKRGYITWNSSSCRLFGGYSVSELLAKIPSSFRIDECPLTFQDNCIILWSSDNH